MLLLEEERKEVKKHSILLPNSIRALFVAPSGGGKTTALISLLLSANGIKFENLFVYSKSLGQYKYRFLEKVIQGIDEINLHTFSNTDDIMKVEDVPPDSVIVFDDISLENQDVVRDFFSRGRHFGIDCFYLCQSYSQIPKHLIRDNVNYLAIFSQDHFNLRNIHKSHVNSDMSFDEFSAMCNKCWERDYGFLVINKDEKINKGRYKMGYDVIIIPEQYEQRHRVVGNRSNEAFDTKKVSRAEIHG